MIKKTIFTLLVLRISCNMFCFANTEPNHIDFDDIFYKQTLLASIDEEYKTESGDIPIHVLRSQKKKLIQEAISADNQFSEALSCWNDPNLSPEYYRTAAETILVYFELNKRRLLTFSTVVNILGTPDRIYFSGYHSDESGTIASSERFTARYEKQGIDIVFSVMGFCHSISISTSILSQQPERWPQTYAYVKEKPIILNVEKFQSDHKDLLEEVKNAIHDKSNFWDWVSYMERWPPKTSIPYVESKVNIMMIDPVFNDLAIVYLKISGLNRVLYCDTWWLRKDNQWFLQDDHEIHQYFIRINR